MTDAPWRGFLERPLARAAITWTVALAVYYAVGRLEAYDVTRGMARDTGGADARADELAAHVTGSVMRVRDVERARIAGLCEALTTDGDAARTTRWVVSTSAASELRDVSVLVVSADGSLSVLHDRTRADAEDGEVPALDLEGLAAALPPPAPAGRTSGAAHGIASELPSREGLGVFVMGCRATSPNGRDQVVIGRLDVVAAARLALPETLATVALEVESDRAPGLRRWLGPAASGGAPRPALRARPTVVTRNATYPIAPAVAAIIAALGIFFALRPRRREQRALGALEAAVERVGRGDLEVTLASEGGAAGGTFTAFNRMTKELKDARARLVRVERVAAWRDVARRIAHEIKNPLTPIRMAIETLRKAKLRQHPDLDDIFEESTVAVLEEVDRMERIVSEFSRFARMPRPQAESLDLKDVAQHVVQVHALPAEVTQPEGEAAAEVKLEAEEGLGAVRADREQLVQVLTNLVQNAIDAAKQKAPEHPRVLVRVLPDDAGARLEVHDNGPGIHPDEQAQVLEPYYTTKQTGTGLGLAIVDRIVADHGGSLSIGESDVLGGACFTVVLRREGPPEEASSSRPSQP